MVHRPQKIVGEIWGPRWTMKSWVDSKRIPIEVVGPFHHVKHTPGKINRKDGNEWSLLGI